MNYFSSLRQSPLTTASLALVAALLLAPVTAQAQIYVDAHAAGANDGSSWTDAYTDLQSALSVATGSDEIWIAGGTYVRKDKLVEKTEYEITNEQDGLHIYGGFAGTETARSERNPSAHPVIINGDIEGSGALEGNGYHMPGASNATVLANVTVTSGR